MKTQEFFEAVYKGELFDSDIYNHIEKITDGFNPEKLQRLCDDFDLYLVKKFNEDHESAISLLVKKKDGEISEEEYCQKIKLRNKPILFIDDFFSDRSQSNIDEKTNKLSDYTESLDDIDLNEINLTTLRNILIDLKKKHIINNLHFTKFDDIPTKNLKKIVRKEIHKDFEKISFGEYSNSKQHEFIDKKANGNIEKLEGLISDIESYKCILKFFGTDEITDRNFENLDYFISKVRSRIDKLDKAKSVDTNNSELNSNHINWLKSDESREQFIEALKEHDLIESRDTKAIIKDHFKPVREQNRESEPIIWLDNQNVLVYLFRNLYRKPYFINPEGKKWELVSEHFIKKSGEQFKVRSLTVEAGKQKEGVLPANGTTTIDKIVDRLITD
jgi:hypothetical protein